MRLFRGRSTVTGMTLRWLACLTLIATPARSETLSAPALLGSTLTFWEANGTLPPRYHRETRIVLLPDQTGEMLSWTGYAGPDKTAVRRRFKLEPSCRARLVDAILAADLGAAHWQSPPDPAVGSGTSGFEASGPGVSLKVFLRARGPDTPSIAPVIDAFGACVTGASPLP